MGFLLALLLFSQDFSQRGFLESRATFYPEAGPNDSHHVTGEVLLRHESFYKPWDSLQVAAAVDLHTDTHHQAERHLRFDWPDRSLKRPLLSLRRLSVQYYRGGFTLEAGKQFVRWGKTDIVNPTDRFAPRDLLTVTESDFMGILAVRATYERGSETFDAVWSPGLTPSRIPLQGQRWDVGPAPALPVVRVLPDYSDTQIGLRWSHVGQVEFAAAYYSGFNHLPSFELDPHPFIRQYYPKLRMAGGDVAVPLRFITIKAEAGYFTSPDDRSDEYVLYVIQFEKQAGEWFLVGGYGGETVTREGIQAADFNPDRGLIRTILARAGYTIDSNRSIAFETAIRQNADGAWVKAEYSQALGQHWRITTGFSLIRGEAGDFLGQFNGNSHGLIAVKYSF